MQRISPQTRRHPWFKLFLVSVGLFAAGNGLIIYSDVIISNSGISSEIVSSVGVYLSLVAVLAFLVSFIMPLRRKIKEKEGGFGFKRFFEINLTKFILIIIIIVLFSVFKGLPTYTNPLCKPGELCSQIWGFIPLSTIITDFDKVGENLFIDWSSFLIELFIIYLVTLVILYFYVSGRRR